MTFRLIETVKLKDRSRIPMDFKFRMWLSCNKLWYTITRTPKGLILTDSTSDGEPRDTILEFRPQFDSLGLVTAVVVDTATNDVLMVAHMNDKAIEETLQTGLAHFWSRSRGTLWKKGETSGNILRVLKILIDCDQDTLLLHVKPSGPACHTGARTCFYRQLERGALVKVKS